MSTDPLAALAALARREHADWCSMQRGYLCTCSKWRAEREAAVDSLVASLRSASPAPVPDVGALPLGLDEIDTCQRVGRDEEARRTTIGLPELDALCSTARAAHGLARKVSSLGKHAAATESRAALAENALAACVEALTRIRDEAATPDWSAVNAETVRLVANEALARARAPGRVVASVEGTVREHEPADTTGCEPGDVITPPIVWLELPPGCCRWDTHDLSINTDAHPALAALPVGARVRVLVVAETAGEKGTPA